MFVSRKSKCVPSVEPCFLTLMLAGLVAYGQDTFTYDQQSSNETTNGGKTMAIQANEPIGQSFTAALSSVGFIRLFLSDNAFDSVGATVYVNLRTNSIT